MTSYMVHAPPQRKRPRPHRRAIFIDCARYRLKHWPCREDLKFLRKHCRSVNIRVGHPILRGEARGFRYLLTVTVPDREARQLLADLDAIPNYVEIALDLGFRSVTRALDWFYLHWRKPRRGCLQEVQRIGDTVYTALRGRCVVAMYCDRPSKITGDPCLHLEVRLQGAEILRKHDIDADALVDLDVEHVLDSNLHFYDWDERFDDIAVRALGRLLPCMSKIENGWLLGFDVYPTTITDHTREIARSGQKP